MPQHARYHGPDHAGRRIERNKAVAVSTHPRVAMKILLRVEHVLRDVGPYFFGHEIDAHSRMTGRQEHVRAMNTDHYTTLSIHAAKRTLRLGAIDLVYAQVLDPPWKSALSAHAGDCQRCLRKIFARRFEQMPDSASL